MAWADSKAQGITEENLEAKIADVYQYRHMKREAGDRLQWRGIRCFTTGCSA